MRSWKLMVGIWVVLFSLSTVKIQAQIFQNDYQYITIAELLPDTMDGWIWDDSLGKVEVKKWYFNSLILDNDVDVSRLSNEIRLKDAEKEIILNQLFAPTPEIIGEQEAADCYEPRHAILFYNQQDVLVGMVEVCFMCFKTKEAGISMDTGISMYPDNFNQLKDFFGAKGLNVKAEIGKPNYQYISN